MITYTAIIEFEYDDEGEDKFSNRYIEQTMERAINQTMRKDGFAVTNVEVAEGSPSETFGIEEL